MMREFFMIFYEIFYNGMPWHAIILLLRVKYFGPVRVNIHKPCLSVYIQTSEILYIAIVNIQKYKLRMLMNTPILSLTL